MKFAFRGGCVDEETGGQSILGSISAANGSISAGVNNACSLDCNFPVTYT